MVGSVCYHFYSQSFAGTATIMASCVSQISDDHRSHCYVAHLFDHAALNTIISQMAISHSLKWYEFVALRQWGQSVLLDNFERSWITHILHYSRWTGKMPVPQENLLFVEQASCLFKKGLLTMVQDLRLPTVSCSTTLMTMDYEGCCQTFKACKLQLKRRNRRSTSVH